MRKLAAGLAVAMLACAGPALADDGDLCAKPTETHGFKTCADLAKAEAEGEIVVYATNPEAAESKVLASFRALFPKIKTSYVRLQAGALYAKVLAERQAKVYAVDILQLSDMGMVLDFQKKGGYVRYVSPEMAAYKPDYKSHPEGLWTWGALGPAGIAYNPDVVSAAEAPKTWQEAIDPKWTDGISVKVSNSGLQHVGWSTTRTRSSTPRSIPAISNGRPRARRSPLSRRRTGCRRRRKAGGWWPAGRTRTRRGFISTGSCRTRGRRSTAGSSISTRRAPGRRPRPAARRPTR